MEARNWAGELKRETVPSSTGPSWIGGRLDDLATGRRMTHHLRAVWTYRHFWLSLVRMDLRQKYRRSVLGLGWSLVNPLAMAAVFCIVFKDLMKVSDWRSYGCYLIGGFAVWDFLRNSLLAGCSTFVRNESYIRQCPLPCGIYPLRTVMGTAIHFLIALGVVIAMVVVLQPEHPLTHQTVNVWNGILPALPGVLLAFVFAWSIATLAAFATIYFHDTQHLCEVGAQLFFFLTPIMYPRSVLDGKGLGWLVEINPVNVYLELIRGPLAFGETPTVALYVQGLMLSTIALGLAIGAIGWLQKKLIFQL